MLLPIIHPDADLDEAITVPLSNIAIEQGGLHPAFVLSHFREPSQEFAHLLDIRTSLRMYLNLNLQFMRALQYHAPVHVQDAVPKWPKHQIEHFQVFLLSFSPYDELFHSGQRNNFLIHQRPSVRRQAIQDFVQHPSRSRTVHHRLQHPVPPNPHRGHYDEDDDDDDDDDDIASKVGPPTRENPLTHKNRKQDSTATDTASRCPTQGYLRAFFSVFRLGWRSSFVFSSVRDNHLLLLIIRIEDQVTHF